MTKIKPQQTVCPLEMLYTDSEGRTTKRVVEVRLWESSRAYLRGFCRKRRALRTFAVDRIQQCLDMETGEIVHNVWDWLTDRRQRSPEGRARVLIDFHRDALSILLYIAKADRFFRKAEREIYAVFLQWAISQQNLDADTAAHFAMEVEALEAPDTQAFHAAVERVAELYPDYRKAVAITAKLMIETDKTIAESEREMFDYLIDTFNLK